MTPEIEVVGQILMNQSKLQSCDLKPDDFINTQYRDIYVECLEMAKDRIAIDPISVAERLETKTGQNWIGICGEVANKAFCHSTFDQQVEKVRRNGQLTVAKDLLSACLYDIERTKSIEPVDRLMQEIMRIAKTRNNHTTNLQDAIVKAAQHLEEVSERKGLPGLTTGLKEVDGLLGGFHKTDLIVVGARPAMGKTALLINFALAGAKEVPVGFVSAEQGSMQIAIRALSIEGSIDSMKMRNASFSGDEWSKLLNAGAALKGRDIQIYDEPGMSISGIVKQAREWKFKHNIQALYVDYIQKIEPLNKFQSKPQQVGEIAGALKNLAKELNIPIVALAQVSRDCEKRDNKRPGNGDLADSSEIEKEADEIITIYRDEVYNINSNDKGIAELLVCKNRHGATGVIRTVWNGPFMQFKDLSTMYGGRA